MQKLGDLAQEQMDIIALKMDFAKLAHEVDRLIATPKATSFAISERIKQMREISEVWTDEYVARVKWERRHKR